MTREGAMRRRLLCLVAVIVMPAAGCGKSGVPAAKPSPNVPTSAPVRPRTSPSPSRTGPLTTGAGVLPGEKPPVEPDLAKQHTVDGAVQFAVYFIRVLSWSVATTDPYLIPKLSAPTCQACKRFVTSLETLRNTGEVAGGWLDIESMTMTMGHGPAIGDQAIEFGLRETRAVVRSAPSDPPATAQFKSIVLVSWISNQWLVVSQGSS